MTQTAPATGTQSPLDAAQKIVADLQGMSSEDQTLALQFAMQTLRLTPPVGHPTFAPAQPNTLSANTALGALGQNVDIKAFTAAKAPKSDQQFTAVVAYFYQFEAKQSDRKDAIDSEAMKEAARLAGWPQVKSWTMTLNNAKNAGYLDPAGKGWFKLSSVGENLVAITLPGNGANAGSNGGGTTKKAAKKKNKKKSTAKRAAKKGR